MKLADLLTQPNGSLPDCLSAVAQHRPEHPALILNGVTLSYREFDHLVSRVAASLQRDGVQPGDVIAACAGTSLEYVALYFGVLRAGGVMTPLPPSATAQNLTGMLANSEASWLFLDQPVAKAWDLEGFMPATKTGQAPVTLKKVWFDLTAGAESETQCSGTQCSWSQWLGAETNPTPVAHDPDRAFNLIYSSGTTGVPKGIVQPCSMRWSQTQRAAANGIGFASVLLLSTPLYSNTTLVPLLPGLALGATAVLMSKFDTRQYLALATRHRATHTVMVPVQYQRLMDEPTFDAHDLSSLRIKGSTSAPFSAALKAEVLRRWPGELNDVYGMTEGGVRCELKAHLHPDKLHTIGQPSAGHDLRLIDDNGVEVPAGHTGEIVGSASAMMKGYHGLPEKTREIEWFDSTDKRFIRTGDIGRFDKDGFVILSDRKKDMVISGGFNIYPSDLEAELEQHPEVAEAAVVGVPSRAWGETPVGYVVLRPTATITKESLLVWVNARLGKTQRLADLLFITDLPRNEIGKTLKRQLREQYVKERQ
jgi:acyl-CoA synthetase (AMP-forming)/AMP-acid ligase II